MPYDSTYHLLWRPDKIRALVARSHPDVVEIHSPYVAAVGVLALPTTAFGIRTFFWHSDFIDTYRRVLSTMHPTWRPLLDGAAVPLWSWVRHIASRCAATICASAWQARKLASHGVETLRVPFGVDKEVFRPAPRETGDTKRLSFVASGRLAVEKRWDVVIDAFMRVSASHPEATLTVFGDGPEREKLERRSRGARIAFMGFERDRNVLAGALARATALLHACPHETFGIAIAEAIASGCPVIVPDEGGAPELARADHSETYRTGDVADCVAGIERLLARNPTTLRAAALDAARGVASVQDHFERLLGHYHELLRC
jgi:alpha-1,6-mannosyltransferase